MQKMMQKTKPVPSPTLDTILMVEQTLQKSNNSIVTVAELKRQLPRKVNHNTLMKILEYLEKSNKIAVTLKGISWIYNTNTNVRRLVSASGLDMGLKDLATGKVHRYKSVKGLMDDVWG